VGLVFQFPEEQLFEETVFADIAFGPRNLGVAPEELNQRVRWAMEAVGLDYDELHQRSPFNLSGGQMRRVAIAGVLAMQPRILILDEPTAGLDPQGRDELFQQIRDLWRKLNLTVVLVSHHLTEMAALAQRLVVLYQGRKILDGPPGRVFENVEQLREIGLGVPVDLLTEEDAAKSIAKAWFLRQNSLTQKAT
jgi:energy-coupling factor transport system ATP-binding protein